MSTPPEQDPDAQLSEFYNATLCLHCREFFTETELRRIDVPAGLCDESQCSQEDGRNHAFYLVCSSRRNHDSHWQQQVCVKNMRITEHNPYDTELACPDQGCNCPKRCVPFIYDTARATPLSARGHGCCHFCAAGFENYPDQEKPRLLVVLQLAWGPGSQDNCVDVITFKILFLRDFGGSGCFEYPNPFFKPMDRILMDRRSSKLGNLHDDSLQWIKEQLNSCQEHVKCREQVAVAGTDNGMPSRLLQIDPVGNGYKVRLTEDVNATSPSRSYVTLSHCWGAAPIACKLTASNRASYKDEIRMDDLPRTFQDAIVFTAMLDRDLLWIDALCIIQDDRADWAHEAPRMAQIYRGGVLNIAAAAASGPNDGLFVQERFRIGRQVQLQWREIPADCRRWYQSSEWNMYLEEVKASPLAKRAWVFQESFISPRTLHFASSQLWWDCREHLGCEFFKATQPSQHLGHRRFKSFQVPDDLKSWQAAVSEYSSRKLTYASDRLVALSAVAQQWASERGYPRNSYLAGLWKQTLLQDLLWSTKTPYGGFEQYVGPTWSWISLQYDGGVEYRSRPTGWSTQDNSKVKLLDSRVEYMYGNEFGLVPLLGGAIELECSLLHIELDTSKPRQRMKAVDGETLDTGQPADDIEYDFRPDKVFDEAILKCWLLPVSESHYNGKMFGGFPLKYKFLVHSLCLELVNEPHVLFRRLGYLRFGFTSLEPSDFPHWYTRYHETYFSDVSLPEQRSSWYWEDHGLRIIRIV